MKTDLREPDPLGYVRTIDKISVMYRDNEMMYTDVKTVYVEI